MIKVGLFKQDFKYFSIWILPLRNINSSGGRLKERWMRTCMRIWWNTTRWQQNRR